MSSISSMSKETSRESCEKDKPKKLHENDKKEDVKVKRGRFGRIIDPNRKCVKVYLKEPPPFRNPSIPVYKSKLPTLPKPNLINKLDLNKKIQQISQTTIRKKRSIDLKLVRKEIVKPVKEILYSETYNQPQILNHHLNQKRNFVADQGNVKIVETSKKDQDQEVEIILSLEKNGNEKILATFHSCKTVSTNKSD